MSDGLRNYLPEGLQPSKPWITSASLAKKEVFSPAQTFETVQGDQSIGTDPFSFGED